MLTLPIKKKWFDMIVSGEKKEEYREIKSYYRTRFENIGLLDINGRPSGIARIRLRCGYSKDAPTYEADFMLRIGTGKPEWGAEPGEKYYVLMPEEGTGIKYTRKRLRLDGLDKM